MTPNTAPYQLLMLIATPKLADKAADLFLKQALPIQYRLNAQGTASSEIMDTLGFGSIDKAVLLSTVPRSFGNHMLTLLHSELRLDAVNSGIAFTIPLTAVSRLLLNLMRQTESTSETTERTKERMTENTNYALIAAIVNRGFSGDVMNAARAAGAGGGTVVHSRSIGNEEAADVWALNLQEEKEIVLILADSKKKAQIMRAVSENWGMHSDAQGTVLALPIDEVMGL